MDQEEFLTVDEVATLIKCSKFTVYGMVARRRIPFKKPSRRLLRFRKSEIIAWLDGGSQGIVEKPTSSERRRAKQIRRAGTKNAFGIVALAKQEVLGV